MTEAASERAFRRMRLREAFRPADAPLETQAKLVGPEGVIADEVEAAVTPMQRARGLLGRPPLEPGKAFIIQPCSQVHTIGMRYPIDAVFCDRYLKVLGVFELSPGRLSRIVRRAWCCIELPAGTADAFGVVPGVRLRLEPRAAAEG